MVFSEITSLCIQRRSMRWFRCQKKWSTGKSQQLTDSVTVIGLAKYSEALKLGIFPNRNWPFVADSRADFAVENYRDN